MAVGNVYSVGQVNAYIARMFSEDYLLRSITVRGEVSNCTYHSSGHIYFTLKDASGTLSCMMYAGKRLGGLSFPMKEGDGVVVSGQIRTYEKQGKYQLYAEHIIRDGVGLLNERYELLKKKLEEMGMFAEEYKQRIPKYIRRLGVVTAPTGAAVRDIIQIAKRRNPYVEILLCPVLVQGDGAPASIVSGIRAMDRAGVDVIILGRGGGSLEDLWAFNEEIVAEAVFECKTPVISAVGHEVDTVITDYVADLRAPTPSAAAELAVFDYNQFEADLASEKAKLLQAMLRKVSGCRERETRLQKELERRSPGMRIQTQRMAAEQLKRELFQNMAKCLERSRRELLLEENLTRAMQAKLEERKRGLLLRERLNLSMENCRKEKRHELQLLAARLEKDSPVAKLSGGYGFVTGADGKNVISVGQLHRGEILTVQLRDGSVKTRVEEIDRGTEEICQRKRRRAFH